MGMLIRGPGLPEHDARNAIDAAKQLLGGGLTHFAPEVLASGPGGTYVRSPISAAYRTPGELNVSAKMRSALTDTLNWYMNPVNRQPYDAPIAPGGDGAAGSASGDGGAGAGAAGDGGDGAGDGGSW